ncbi:unnamed protein product [Chironomus riparius]|uniref:Ion transport domain-containing protein n=1 Tax=Chironomus riparius TaxID=315576 RepID=A0A9N9RRS8_9DIPT|nr:unnamed protein product [Chironomus riparius]
MNQLRNCFAKSQKGDIELGDIRSQNNNQMISASESTNLIQNSRDEYFRCRKILERFFITKKLSSFCSCVDQLNLKEIFVTSVDTSACISLILRHMENKDFWKIKEHEIFLTKFVESTDFKVENLFSILMYDWHEPDKKPHQSYYLVKKLEELTNGNLFKKLWEIMNNQEQKKYHQVCLKILYFYIEEKKVFFESLNDQETKSEINEEEKFSDFLKQRLNEVLSLIPNNEEYKIQVLKILIPFLSYSEFTDDIKLKILQIFGNNTLNDTINEVDKTTCKMSYTVMTKNCDEVFFKLAFIMKKNFTMNFKIGYKKFIEIYKNYFGEYWNYEIVQNAKLLLLMADIQNLTDTREFILITTEKSRLRSDLLQRFKNVAEFQAVFNEPLDDAVQVKMVELKEFVLNFENISENKRNNFKKLFKNTPEIRRLLFGRATLEGSSLFEIILSNNLFCDIIEYIWNEFGLWEKPEILSLKNYNQKFLMDYVLEAKHDMHFIRFLMVPVSKEYEKIQRPIHYMMLKNSLFYDTSNIINSENSANQTNVPIKCIFEYEMSLIDQNETKDYENLQNFLYLLEEIYQYCPDKNGKNKFFVDFLKQIISEKKETFNKEHELKMPRKHFYIGLMMIYWGYYIKFRKIGREFSIELHGPSEEDVVTLNESIETIPFFEILSLIIQKKEDEVIKGLTYFYENMEKLYLSTYNIESNYSMDGDPDEIFHFYEKYSTNFSFIFVYAAIKTNQKNIMNAIFEYNHFLISCPSFPQNMKADDIHCDTVAKFIENRYELGRGDLPKHWISQKMLKNFLDSRITCEDNFYKVDCRFMLPYYNYDKVDEKAGDDMILNEDYDTMKYILNDYNLKSLVSHPVMEMIIRAKISKYYRLFFWNLVLFLTFYVFPTILLVVQLHSTQIKNSTVTMEDIVDLSFEEDNSTRIVDDPSELPDMALVEFDYGWIILLTLIRVPILLLREIFQMLFREKIKEYFNKKSNWIEISLIILPIIQTVPIFINWSNPSTEAFIAIAIIEVINIILMITATVSLYPILKFSIYMKCFFKVFLTYLRVFGLLLPLFLACVAIVFIVFDKKIGGGIVDFYSFANTCVKYIIMYSGELSIDADQINGILQVTAMLVIIFLIINKGNLILSIVIDDVQKIMRQAKEISLRLYAAKYVEFAEGIRTFYANYFHYKDENQQKCCTKLKNQSLFWLVKFFTKKYSQLHRINFLYVEKKSGKVFIIKRRPLFESWNFITRTLNKLLVFRFVLSYWNKFFSHLDLDADTMKKIAKIMSTDGDADDED